MCCLRPVRLPPCQGSALPRTSSGVPLACSQSSSAAILPTAHPFAAAAPLGLPLRPVSACAATGPWRQAQGANVTEVRALACSGRGNGGRGLRGRLRRAGRGGRADAAQCAAARHRAGQRGARQYAHAVPAEPLRPVAQLCGPAGRSGAPKSAGLLALQAGSLKVVPGSAAGDQLTSKAGDVSWLAWFLGAGYLLDVLMLS